MGMANFGKFAEEIILSIAEGVAVVAYLVLDMTLSCNKVLLPN